MHILIVEDNHDIAEAIGILFTQQEWNYTLCHHGDDAMIHINTHHYDCIVLDIMLPGPNGIDLLKAVREKHNTPVIMTTAKGTMNDKTLGFETGADDYLVKPYNIKELIMRIKSLTKRYEQSTIFSRGECDLHLDQHQAYKKGESISLTTKERHIISTLIEHRGRTVTRANLIDLVWGDDALRDNKSDKKLDVYISNLRKKLDKELIVTIKGVGYTILD